MEGKCMEPMAMPMTQPDDVTFYDGNTMTAGDWRRMTEPVTGYTEISTSDLDGRRVRAVKHTEVSKWVVTVDTVTNSWAYLIQPIDGNGGDKPRQPVSVAWAYATAVFGLDSRITPAVAHRHFDLPSGGTGLIAKTGDNMWVVGLWHGYWLDFKWKGQEEN